MTGKEREVLRELAKKVAEIAALPQQQKTINLWKGLNGLKPQRPMVMIDQIPWHEINVDDELTLRTEGEFARELETRLRRTLYRWKHMPVDMVVERTVQIEKVIRDDGWGIQYSEDVAVGDPQNDVKGHFYLDNLKDDADLAKVHAPRVWLDKEATAKREEEAHAAFDGILAVEMIGREAWSRAWDWYPCMHGVENSIWDLADRPEFVHRVLKKYNAANMAYLDSLEEQGLLAPMTWVHCTGGYSDELPAKDFAGKYRAKDVWTAGMAQIFSTVSPAMHDEFEIQYQIPWYARFGLGYYGCCEPLDLKIEVIRKIPKVRKISQSPWVNVERGAEAIGKDYVFSRKPSPAFLSVDDWNPKAVEKDLRETVTACKRHGCPVELILKDISTVLYKPQHLWEWSQVAMKLVQE